MQPCWREIRECLHKEMNLGIKSSYYEALNKNKIFPPWTIAFQPPPNLMSSQCQIETIISLRKTQARDMLNTPSQISTEEANQCKDRADFSTKTMKAYYQQPGATQYNFNEALDALVTLMDSLQKTSACRTTKEIFRIKQ